MDLRINDGTMASLGNRTYDSHKGTVPIGLCCVMVKMFSRQTYRGASVEMVMAVKRDERDGIVA